MTSGRRGGRGGLGMGEVGEEDDGGGGGGRVVEEIVEEGVKEGSEGSEGETRSIMRVILSSSSGQMSGQCVKPK